MLLLLLVLVNGKVDLLALAMPLEGRFTPSTSQLNGTFASATIAFLGFKIVRHNSRIAAGFGHLIARASSRMLLH